jgi:ABC-type multidrug transport system permease subunit
MNSPADYVQGGKFECATAQIASDTFNGAWSFSDYDQIWVPFVAMFAMIVVQMVLLLVILKRRDPV